MNGVVLVSRQKSGYVEFHPGHALRVCAYAHRETAGFRLLEQHGADMTRPGAAANIAQDPRTLVD